MKPVQRARIRRAAIAISATAALMIASAAPAIAGPNGSGKNPAPAKRGQGVADGSDAFEAMKSALGLTGMKNQEDLIAYKSWLITLPG
jgi:hypothetical protein